MIISLGVITGVMIPRCWKTSLPMWDRPGFSGYFETEGQLKGHGYLSPADFHSPRGQGSCSFNNKETAFSRVFVTTYFSRSRLPELQVELEFRSITSNHLARDCTKCRTDLKTRAEIKTEGNWMYFSRHCSRSWWSDPQLDQMSLSVWVMPTHLCCIWLGFLGDVTLLQALVLQGFIAGHQRHCESAEQLQMHVVLRLPCSSPVEECASRAVWLFVYCKFSLHLLKTCT